MLTPILMLSPGKKTITSGVLEVDIDMNFKYIPQIVIIILHTIDR